MRINVFAITVFFGLTMGSLAAQTAPASKAPTTTTSIPAWSQACRDPEYISSSKVRYPYRVLGDLQLQTLWVMAMARDPKNLDRIEVAVKNAAKTGRPLTSLALAFPATGEPAFGIYYNYLAVPQGVLQVEAPCRVPANNFSVVPGPAGFQYYMTLIGWAPTTPKSNTDGNQVANEYRNAVEMYNKVFKQVNATGTDIATTTQCWGSSWAHDMNRPPIDSAMYQNYPSHQLLINGLMRAWSAKDGIDPTGKVKASSLKANVLQEAVRVNVMTTKMMICLAERLEK